MNYSLTDLPNIGRAIATDLKKIGINFSSDIEKRNPLSIFEELRTVMGKCHGPCVYIHIAFRQALFADR
jgi:DNA transformation protein